MNVRKGAVILLSGVMMWGSAVYLPQYSSVLSNSVIDAKAYSYNGEIRNNGLGGIYIDINAEPFTWASFQNGSQYGPQGCAWFASARARQLTGKGTITWAGNSWWDGKDGLGFSRGSTPQAPALICYSGHVAVLEKIIDGVAYISEGGVVDYPSNSYCHIRTASLSQLPLRNDFLGYVYLGAPMEDIITPTISIPKTTYTLCETVSLSWVPSSSNSNLSHYWISVYSPGAANDIQQRIEPPTTTASFVPKTVGEYTITISATPRGSVEGEGSITNTVKILVSDSQFKGDGTAASPYLISSAEDLRKLSSLMSSDSTAAYYGNKYYEQTADIDLENELFTPIGCYYAEKKGNGFKGHYNGKYHSIKNLNISRKFNYNGLFGWLYDGAGVENLNVYGQIDCPGNSHVGGITGEVANATVKNCSFNGSVSADSTVGGITGTVYRGGIIDSCYVNGNIASTKEPDKAGGIVGYAVIGNETGDFSFTMKNCYAVTQNIVNGGNIGLLTIDGSLKSSTFENNFYLKTMSSKGINGDISKGCAGLTEELMKESAAELLGEPFVENTSSGEKLINDGYPIFSWQAPAYEFKGDGTEESPYLITSKKELEIFRDLTNDELRYSEFNKKSFKLTTDIDLSGEQWTPIAKRLFNGTDKEMYFCGHFDGANHTITGLNVNEKSKFAGLFGSISNGAIVENLAVQGKVVNTTLSTGGVVGELCLGDAIVRNCCFIGDVTGADQAVGGVVGYLYQTGRVQNCYHIGTVTCPDHSCGGVVGKAVNETAKTKALIENCYHVGKLTGTTGTVVGMIDEKAEDGAYVEVKNCFGLTTDGKLCAVGEGKTFDAMQCTESVMKKSASLLGDAFATNPDATVISGYPIFTWQDKTNPGTNESKVVYGDSNGDEIVDLSDAVLIMQTLSNPSKFKLTDQGRKNADCYNNGDGVTNADALAIQKYKLSLITSLPEKK